MTIGDIQGPRSPTETNVQEEPRNSAAPQAINNLEITRAIGTIDEAGGVSPNSELRLAIDRATGQPLIKVVSRLTNEVIAQVPPETILRAAEILRHIHRQERVG